jgi:hypothetical protein
LVAVEPGGGDGRAALVQEAAAEDFEVGAKELS